MGLSICYQPLVFAIPDQFVADDGRDMPSAGFGAPPTTGMPGGDAIPAGAGEGDGGGAIGLGGAPAGTGCVVGAAAAVPGTAPAAGRASPVTSRC